MASDPAQPKTLDPQISPNKRLKTTQSSQLKESNLQQQHDGDDDDDDDDGDSLSIPSSSSKPVQLSSAMDSDEKNVCGICLLEEGNSIRGYIDSCDHHFCFVCIMEWSKVETRCPMCKSRFSSIRRQPKPGVFPTERIVNVPIRNQVYHPLGITTITDADPYAEVNCVWCHSMADETLLLLCDLCDTAAHTYCVGLGATVPEGDWFCTDCTVSRADHASVEVGNTDCINENTEVSIFDIVRGPVIPYRDRLPRIASLRPENSSCVPNERTKSGTRTCHPDVVDRANDSNARTLKRCRNVQGRIRVLRENWNALRVGRLSFSSSSADLKNKSKRKLEASTPLHPNGVVDPTPSSSTTCPQLESQVGSSADTKGNKSKVDIKKAWKMMDMAKSIQPQRGHKMPTSVNLHQPPKFALGKGSTSMDSRSQLFGSDEMGISARDTRCPSLGLQSENRASQNIEKRKQSRTNVNESLLPTDHRKQLEFPSSIKGQTYINTERVLGELSGYARLTSITGSQTEASYLKPELDVTPSCALDIPKEKTTVKNGYAQSKAKIDDSAKSEIQSLVKLNLKLLNKSKNLGVDKYKEIARLATHTIMAACGLEHPKPGISTTFLSSICSHSEDFKKHRKSTLMPSSCRECFYVFVKDIVNSILVEKSGHG